VSPPDSVPDRPEVRVLPTRAGIEQLDAREHFCVVVDVLRASTVIAYALDAGARGVIPVASVEEATRLFSTLDRGNTLLAGERDSQPIEGFHLGNSPAEIRPDVVAGKTLLLTTTNGATALAALSGARGCATASLVNVTACAETLAGQPRVAIVCAGSQGRFSLEDFLCAGMIVDALLARVPDAALDDGAHVARRVASSPGQNLVETLRKTDHGRRLVDLGFERDLALTCDVDRFPTLPVLRDGRLVAEAGASPARLR
jgi:2-phosphosulfolactate phosphatase